MVNIVESARYRLTRWRINRVKDDIRGRNIVWHVCTPKSASTFFMNYCMHQLANSSDAGRYKLVSAVPEYGNRPQITCPFSLHSRLTGFSKNGFAVTKHQHCLATNDLLSLISENHRVLVQTRSLLDTLVSLRDHLDREPQGAGPWLFDHAAYWSRLSGEEKIDLLIINYVPWHIQFLQGWLRAADGNRNVIISDFDCITSETQAVFERIFGSVALDNVGGFTPNQKNSRFNKGVSGRGRDLLSQGQLSSIKFIVEKCDVLGQGLTKYL